MFLIGSDVKKFTWGLHKEVVVNKENFSDLETNILLSLSRDLLCFFCMVGKSFLFISHYISVYVSLSVCLFVCLFVCLIFFSILFQIFLLLLGIDGWVSKEDHSLNFKDEMFQLEDQREHWTFFSRNLFLDKRYTKLQNLCLIFFFLKVT
jgi:ABC-type transport system involved in multi-copper enzyme maturation permease subunit